MAFNIAAGDASSCAEDVAPAVGLPVDFLLGERSCAEAGVALVTRLLFPFSLPLLAKSRGVSSPTSSLDIRAASSGPKRRTSQAMTINAKIGIAYASSPPLPLLGRPARTAIVGGGTRGTLRHETHVW